MARAQRHDGQAEFDRVVGAGSVVGLDDADLLDRFVVGRGRDAEAAFEAIVTKHGPMVLGVCRSLLHDPADTDDAFQGTFLVLVRKAGSVRVVGSLGPWLHAVARRVATRARTRSQRARSHLVTRREAIEPTEVSRREVQAVVIAEVDRLPAKYRSPVILCHLEGLSHAEAAERLGWPVGTVSGRLSRARDLLRARFQRQGLAIPATVLAGNLAPVVPVALLQSTVHLGRSGAVAAVSLKSLIKGTSLAMFITRLKVASLLGVTLVSLTIAAGYVAGQVGTTSLVVPPKPQPPNTTGLVRADLKALIQARIDLASQTYAELEDSILHPTPPFGTNATVFDQLALWSSRWMEASRDLDGSKAGRIAALEAHLARLTHWDQLSSEVIEGSSGKMTTRSQATIKYDRLQAEFWLAEEKKP